MPLTPHPSTKCTQIVVKGGFRQSKRKVKRGFREGKERYRAGKGMAKAVQRKGKGRGKGRAKGVQREGGAEAPYRIVNMHYHPHRKEQKTSKYRVVS